MKAVYSLYDSIINLCLLDVHSLFTHPLAEKSKLNDL